MKTKKPTQIPRAVAIPIINGCAVITPEGRAGVVVEINYPQAVVAFGSGGPCYSYNWKSLRRLTRKEVDETGLEGVGCYALGEEE